ncbi:MAG: hypothetical protein ACE5EN_11555, partial [Nitrospinota bacterium]
MHKDVVNLPRNLRQLEAIFNRLPDGIITISGTKPSLISNINAVACKILNVEKQKVLGERIQSVFKAQYSPLLQIIKETLEQNRCIKNFNLELET